ncbi:hypothetical protein [Fructilactobacillus sanfranciscensis]
MLNKADYYLSISSGITKELEKMELKKAVYDIAPMSINGTNLVRQLF